MVELALLVASVLGISLAISDDRLTRVNRMMPIADFQEANLLARCLIAWLGEGAGWTALQVCGVFFSGTMLVIAALYPWMGWACVATLAAGLVLVSFDLFHDGREVRKAMADGYRLGIRRSAR